MMERIPYFTKRKIGFLIMIVIFIFCLAFYFKMVFPAKTDITIAKNKLHVEQELIATYQKQKQKRTNEFNQGALEKIVPSQESIDDLLIFLDKAESNSKSKIDNITFDNDGNVDSQGAKIQSPNMPSGLKKINLQLTVSATDIQKLLAFLDNLEKSPRRILINNVTLSTKNGATNSITINTKISTFYFDGKN